MYIRTIITHIPMVESLDAMPSSSPMPTRNIPAMRRKSTTALPAREWNMSAKTPETSSDR